MREFASQHADLATHKGETARRWVQKARAGSYSRDDRPWHTGPHVACTAWSRSGPAVRRREELGDHMRCSLHDDHCHAARSRSCQALMSAVSWAHTARSHEETRPPSLQDAPDRRPVSPHDLIKPRSPRLQQAQPALLTCSFLQMLRRRAKNPG